MRRKRFKHQVDTFCEIFTGWQLISDIELLAKLENGNLQLVFNDNKVYLNGDLLNQKLNLMETISGWFEADLLNHKIDKSEFNNATLLVKFNIKRADLVLRRERKTLEVTMNLVGSIETSDKLYSKEKFYYDVYRLP